MDLNGDVESLAGFQLSQFYLSCLDFRPVVSVFGWMSQFWAGFLIFRPAASFSVQLSQISSSCVRIND
ncbi:hypothetical protein V9T40_001970 [Parthenolecanium corni]|uniref:Uncharacterized protein n=1 Tax=Parthenolecanium corni TaxID=536013 RepID=A0AAN9Y3Z2_9HEMI